MVGVLGDEPLPVLVDDDPCQQDLRRVGRSGDEQLVEVLGDAAGRHPEPDAQPVVVGVAQDVGRHHAVVFGLAFLAERRRVLGDHLGIHREPARRDHHRLRFDRTGFGEVLPAHPDNRAIAHREVGGTGLVSDLHAEFGGALEQQFDDHVGATEFAGHRHRMTAWCGLGLLDERPHLLVAGIRQPLGARWHHHLARVVAALELKSQ
ncbi:hypothetical protein MYFR107205_30510 [Mycolicibacterium frederiksbergense]